MSQRIFEGRWEKIRREHDAELEGHDVTLIVTDTKAENKSSAVSGAKAKTMYDLFEGRLGLVDSGGKECLSEDCGEKFTDYLEEKRRQGNL